MIRPFCTLALLLLSISMNGSRSDAAEPASTPAKINQEDLGRWVEQLSHDQFHRRVAATQKLIDAGAIAVDALVSAMGNGDLETSQRAVFALGEIAVRQSPHEDGGAWGQLQTLSQSGSGSRSALANTAVNEIREIRSRQALEALDRAGIFIGVDEFVVRAVISPPQMVVQIDDRWSGDVESLKWLRWVHHVEYARVKGPALKSEVLEQVALMPDLKILAIAEGNIDVATLTPIQRMDHLDSLEFRYVPLTPELGDQIAKIPMRISLNLMGTGISKEKVEQMRESLPGLSIDHRQGGFLGVSCLSGFNVCRVNDIVAGSAAETAGLERGDEIIRIGKTEIGKFEDLQDAINQHMPGDEIEIEYRRHESLHKLKLKLGKLEKR